MVFENDGSSDENDGLKKEKIIKRNKTRNKLGGKGTSSVPYMPKFLYNTLMIQQRKIFQFGGRS